MRLVRYQDWPSRLAAFIESAKGVPFSWGQWDCCLTACSAVTAITGTDPAAALRGKYKTRLGAYRILKKIAGSGLGEAAGKVARELGAKEISVSHAQRGDVVLLNTDFGESLGVVDLSGNISVAGAEGLVSRPLRSAWRAWRVG